MWASNSSDSGIGGLRVLWDGRLTAVLWADGGEAADLPAMAAEPIAPRADLLAVFGVAGAAGWSEGVLLDAFRAEPGAAWLRPVVLQDGHDTLTLVRASGGAVQEIARIALQRDIAAAPDKGLSVICIGRSRTASAESQPILAPVRMPAGKLDAERTLQLLQRSMQNRAEELIWAGSFYCSGSHGMTVTPVEPLFPPEDLPISVEPRRPRQPRPRIPVQDYEPSIRRLLRVADSDPADPGDAPVALSISVPRHLTQGRSRGNGLVLARIFYQRRVYARQKDDPADKAIALPPLDHRDLEQWGKPPQLTPPGSEFIAPVNLHWLVSTDDPTSGIQVELIANEKNDGLMAATHDTYLVSFHGVGRGDAIVVLDTAGGDLHGSGVVAGAAAVAYRLHRDGLTALPIDVEDPQLAMLWTAGGYHLMSGGARSVERETSLAGWLRSAQFPPGAFPARFNPAHRLTPLLLLAYDDAVQAAARQRSAAPPAGPPAFLRFARAPAGHRFLCDRPDIAAALRDPKAEGGQIESGHLAYRIAAALGRPDLFAAALPAPAQLAAFQLLEEQPPRRIDLAVKTGIRFDAVGWDVDVDMLEDLPEILAEAELYREILEDYGERDGALLIADYQDKRSRRETISAGSVAALHRAGRLAKSLVAEADASAECVTIEQPAAEGLSPPPQQTLEEMLQELRGLLERAQSIGSPALKKRVDQYRKVLAGSEGRSRRFCRGAIRALRTALAAPNMISTFTSILSGLESWAALDDWMEQGQAPPPPGEDALRTQRERIAALAERARLNKLKDPRQLTRTHRQMVADLTAVMGPLIESGGGGDDAIRLLSDYARVLVYHRAYTEMRSRLKRAATEGTAPGELLRRLMLWPRQAEITLDQFDNWERRNGGTGMSDALRWRPDFLGAGLAAQ
jgi:hypothetical protein